jgi:transposase
MTNFATYIDSTNSRADVAQRGKAKQKRTDLRLVGLGLVITRDGGIPLLSHTYPGNKPDVTQFPTMLAELAHRHQAITGPDTTAADLTVVFDAGQNSRDNFALFDSNGLHFVGSIPPSDCPDLLALPAKARTTVDEDRYPGLTAIDTRRSVYGKDRRVVLTHSPSLHDGQSRGLDQTLTKTEARLTELADTLERGKTRRTRQAVEAEIADIVANPWVKRILTFILTGDAPAEHRLAWHVNTDERAALEDEQFGKRILVTDHDDWPVADVVAAYRSQSDAEFGLRQLKDPHVVSFSPMHHFTDHNIRVHTQTCVFALMVAHLMRRLADQAGLHLSVRELLDQLAGIEETVLIYPSTGGRPKARRMLTETSTTQDDLIKIFNLDRWAPRT